MASQNAIANWTMDLIGEASIDDVNDTTERAVRLLSAWDSTRDAALRARWWRFSIARRSLAADADAPDWGFAKQYTIDADVVRVIQVDQFYPGIDISELRNGDTAPYAIEVGKILTDIAAPLKVRWILNSVEVGLWDPCFAKVLACDLADRLSTRITGSETIKARIKAERRDALAEAIRANALEAPPQERGDGSWMASRQSI